jgi:hypothetical protein
MTTAGSCESLNCTPLTCTDPVRPDGTWFCATRIVISASPWPAGGSTCSHDESVVADQAHSGDVSTRAPICPPEALKLAGMPAIDVWHFADEGPTSS